MSARILFVEDDALVRHGLTRVLAAAGHDVRACGSVKDARLQVQSFDPQLLLLDIGLPDGDGIRCAGMLREQGCNAALVFLTAHHERKEVEAAIGQGAHGYLVKPITGAQLIPAIEAALASARTAAERERTLLVALRDSREISAAVGALAQREGCTTDAAFDHLRQQARTSGRKLTDVAAGLLSQLSADRKAPGLGKGAAPKQ